MLSMRKPAFYPILALILGGSAIALRMWQKLAGYDASGLPIPMSPPSVLLTVFLFLCGAFFLYLSFLLPKTLEGQSSLIPDGRLPVILLCVSAALLLVGGILNLKDFAAGWLDVSSALYGSAKDQSNAVRAFVLRNLLPLILTVASIPAAVSLLYQARKLHAGQENTHNAFSALMPSFFCWIWLIEAYRQHTANPIVWDYVLLLLAVVALLVSGYFRAGFAFGVGKPRRAVAASLLALFFAVAALPDSGGPANAVTLLALLLYTLIQLYALLFRLSPPYRPRRLAPDAPVPQTDSQQQEDVSHEQ